MATQTVRMTANSSWRRIANGAQTITLNPEKGTSYLVIKASNTIPNSTYGNTFVLKTVSAEQMTQITMSANSFAYIRSAGVSNSIISFVRG
jgi:hypothetical protein